MDFFANKEHQTRLEWAAAAWIDTPFRPHTRVKNGGVDCVNLVSALMEECGVEHAFAPPEYGFDWGHHGPYSQLLKYLRDEPRVRELAADKERLPGDILTFKIGGVEHHAGVLLQGQIFIHTARGLGTVLDQLTGSWLERLSVCFRVTS